MDIFGIESTSEQDVRLIVTALNALVSMSGMSGPPSLLFLDLGIRWLVIVRQPLFSVVTIFVTETMRPISALVSWSFRRVQ